MKYRVLKKLTLQQAIEMFASRKWNFYEVRQYDKMVRLEAPVGTGEAYVVELPYRDQEELQKMVEEMQQHGFPLQESA